MQWPKIDWQGWGRTAAFTATVLAALWTYAPAPQPNPEPGPQPVPPPVVTDWHLFRDGKGYSNTVILKAVEEAEVGTYTAEGYVEGADPVKRTLVVSAGVVPPKPPVPPEPPKPPGPPPSPPPIAETGLRVLIVYETDTELDGTLPKPQREIIKATAPGSVRDYLNTHCVKVGSEPERRILDKDQPDNLAHESPIWQAVWKRERKSIPWIVVSNGHEGFEGPLPATPAETLSLLQRFEVK